MYLNQKKKYNEKVVFKFAYLSINTVIRWNFNFLNVLCVIIFPSCALSDTDQT